jgi:hypothetical protein
MREGQRADDWLPDSLQAGAKKGALPSADADPSGWASQERRLRAKRLSNELSEWVSELRARSDALDSRLRDAEAAR